MSDRHCRLCTEQAEYEVEIDGVWYLLCKRHGSMDDADLVLSILGSCADCGGAVEEQQPRGGKYFGVCNECARRFTIDEIKKYKKGR